jgi:translation elongation factor EF-1alpha
MEGSKQSLSVCFIGDVSSGKSTIAAHLALKLGTFTQRELEKVEKSEGFSREKRYSWLLDRSQQVREAIVLACLFHIFFFFSSQKRSETKDAV